LNQHTWEVAGCIALLVLFVGVILAFGLWLDDQGEPEAWWGNEE